MRTDLEMLEFVTGAFMGGEEDTTDWDRLRDSLPDGADDDSLLGHLEALHSDGYLESADGSPGIGVTRDSEGKLSISVLPLRLSEEGHRLAKALHTPGASKFIEKFAKDAQLTIDLVTKAIHAGSPIGFKLND